MRAYSSLAPWFSLHAQTTSTSRDAFDADLVADPKNSATRILSLAQPPRREEVEGLELQFATNVLAYFVLMRSLLPAMTRGGRVVLVASQLTNELDLGDLQSRRGAAAESHVVRYAKTKTAVRMLAAEAAAPGRAFAEQGVAVVACQVALSRMSIGVVVVAYIMIE